VSKRSSQDKTEGAMDKVTGRAKEATGSLTGNKDKKAEGVRTRTRAPSRRRRAPSRTS
jgi:uncharacterized protein YjbJ (UPF0337 family)